MVHRDRLTLSAVRVSFGGYRGVICNGWQCDFITFVHAKLFGGSHCRMKEAMELFTSVKDFLDF